MDVCNNSRVWVVGRRNDGSGGTDCCGHQSPLHRYRCRAGQAAVQQQGPWPHADAGMCGQLHCTVGPQLNCGGHLTREAARWRVPGRLCRSLAKVLPVQARDHPHQSRDKAGEVFTKVCILCRSRMPVQMPLQHEINLRSAGCGSHRMRSTMCSNQCIRGRGQRHPAAAPGPWPLPPAGAAALAVCRHTAAACPLRPRKAERIAAPTRPPASQVLTASYLNDAALTLHSGFTEHFPATRKVSLRNAAGDEVAGKVTCRQKDDGTLGKRGVVCTGVRSCWDLPTPGVCCLAGWHVTAVARPVPITLHNPDKPNPSRTTRSPASNLTPALSPHKPPHSLPAG